MAPPTRFTDHLRREAAPIWDAIFRHPFLRAVQEGTLPEERFRYYLAQDYHYIGAFGKAVAVALAKAPDARHFDELARRLTTPIERPLHRRLFALAGMDEEEVRRARPSPTCLAYMDHLLATALTGDVGLISAALLPCPWTYHELGSRLQETRNPLYAEWASFYREGFLAESVTAWRALVDRAAEPSSAAYRGLLEEAFLTSSRYEWMFWEMAYRTEKWPV
ncbi:MAG: thiaminase II [Chloroflexi bacterium]|nr:thiaminase II [Chloroflexota bacterium]